MIALYEEQTESPQLLNDFSENFVSDVSFKTPFEEIKTETQLGVQLR